MTRETTNRLIAQTSKVDEQIASMQDKPITSMKNTSPGKVVGQPTSELGQPRSRNPGRKTERLSNASVTNSK